MKLLVRLCLFTFLLANMSACSTAKKASSAMKVTKDDVLNYRVTQHSNMAISLMGQDMSTVGKQETDYAIKVKEVAPSGDFKTEVTIDRVAFEQKVPMMGDIKYDSADKEGSKNSPMKSLGETVGKRFQVSYGKDGKIVKTEGVEEILGDIMSGIKEPGAAQMLSSFGTEGITGTLRNLSGMMQGNPKVGATWTDKIEAAGIVNMIMDQTFTLKERKNGQSIIEVTGTATSIPNEGGLEFQGMEISYDMAGPITGTIVVDDKTGWAISSDVTPNLKGKMLIKGTPMGDMNVNATMKLGISAVRK